MKELEELRQRMRTERPAAWEQLPDLALYMDQLISYMPRQLIRFENGDELTSAMVNNYIKDGLIPRAEGKRYSREHLAWLTVICALKNVISMREMGALFTALGSDTDRSVQERYADFLEQLDKSLDKVAKPLDPNVEPEGLASLALSLALDSYASKLACQRVLEIMGEQEDPEPGESKESKKKK